MKLLDWILFIVLSLIWGSSFVLMKEGMIALTPYQVAAVRIFSAGLVLLPFTFKAIKQLPRGKMPVIVLAGLMGSFFPSFLFCIAETKLDSALAGILNALTPLFTILVGVLFFELKTTRKKIIGIIIGFAGLLMLFISNGHVEINNFYFILLILIATLMYGVNVNLVGRYMKGIGSFNIAIIAFSFLTFPCLLILIFTGYFKLNLMDKTVMWSTGASAFLGILGTAIANILFYMLLKRAGALFASTVTYCIPIVAVCWGIFYGERIATPQIVSLFIILMGVYLANANNNPFSKFQQKSIEK